MNDSDAVVTDHHPIYNQQSVSTYLDQWQHYLKDPQHQYLSTPSSRSVVFALAWHDDAVDGDDRTYLAGCTNDGEVLIWKAPPNFLRDDLDDDDASRRTNQTTVSSSDPLVRLQVCRGRVLYCIKVVKENDIVWLITAGDTGVYTFDWQRQIRPESLRRDASAAARAVTAAAAAPAPVCRFETHKNPYEATVEINQVDWYRGLLFAAAGDGLCYQWDVPSQSLVSTYRAPPPPKSPVRSCANQYLHTLQVSQADHLLLAGGEDGRLLVWDIQQDRLVDALDLSASVRGTASTTSSRRPPSAMDCWISSCSIAATSSSLPLWWTVGGGCQDATYIANNAVSGTNGYLATVHAATRSVVTCVQTPERPQQILHSPLDDTILLSVGNEPNLSHWHATTLERQEHIWCSPRAGYAVAVAQDGRVAVGGVGSFVDVLEQGTQRTFRFTL